MMLTVQQKAFWHRFRSEFGLPAVAAYVACIGISKYADIREQDFYWWSVCLRGRTAHQLQCDYLRCRIWQA